MRPPSLSLPHYVPWQFHVPRLQCIIPLSPSGTSNFSSRAMLDVNGSLPTLLNWRQMGSQRGEGTSTKSLAGLRPLVWRGWEIRGKRDQAKIRLEQPLRELSLAQHAIAWPYMAPLCLVLYTTYGYTYLLSSCLNFWVNWWQIRSYRGDGTSAESLAA